MKKLKQEFWRIGSRLPFPIVYRLICGRDVRRARSRVERFAREGVGEPLSRRHMDRWRTSDTIFVLGSGSSINELTDEQWREIEASNSIGFNFWAYHEFVPTFYAFEQPNDEGRAQLLYELLSTRGEAYRETPIIAKTLAKFRGENFPPALRENLYLSADYSLPAHDERGFRRALAYLKRRRLLEGPEAIEAIPFKRASISYFLFWALFSGYRKIVLCGVDLNHTGYFFEQRSAIDPHAGIPVLETGQTGEVHRTLDPEVEELTVDLVVYATNDMVLKPAGVELFVGSASSALHPVLPCYFEETSVVGVPEGERHAFEGSDR